MGKLTPVYLHPFYHKVKPNQLLLRILNTKKELQDPGDGLRVDTVKFWVLENMFFSLNSAKIRMFN
jgi:hypothetical protein